MATLTLASRNSMCSQFSKRILDDVVHDAGTHLLKAQTNEINDATINIVWDNLGKYISRSLRNGRGVVIPKFGTFTFSAPLVSLRGVTNPMIRDAQPRVPVFLISPEFVSGGNIKTGIFYGKTGTMRPYCNKGTNGKIHIVKCNYTEVGSCSGVKSDTARTAIERVLKKLANSVRHNGMTHMILPTVGVFHVKNALCAVAFDAGLNKDTFEISNQNYTATDRKKEALKFLTLDRMDQYQMSQSGYDVDRPTYKGRFLSMDNSAKEYLSNQGVDGNLEDKYRPLTAALNYETLDLKANRSWITNNTRTSKLQPRDRASSLTRGDHRTPRMRTQGYDEFVNGGATPDMKSNLNRITMTIKNSLNLKDASQKISEDRLSSLGKKKMGLWMRQTTQEPIDCFFEVLGRELGVQVARRMKVSPEVFSSAVVKCNLGIDQQSADVLATEIAKLREDGQIDAVSFMDYMAVEDRDPLNQLKDVIFLNGLKFEDILKTMNIPKSSTMLNYFKIRDGLLRLDPTTNRAKADTQAQMILKGKDEISVYDFIEALELGIDLSEQQNIESNNLCKQKIRVALLEGTNSGVNILRDEFEKFDLKHEGILDPAGFKTSLLQLKNILGISIGEINRLGRYIKKTADGRINYNDFFADLDKEFVKITLKSNNQYNRETKFTMPKFAQAIAKYLKNENISIRMLIRRILGMDEDVTEEEMQYHKQAVNQSPFFNFINDIIVNNTRDPERLVSDQKIREFCEKIDIDNDGKIDYHDISTFLSRHDFIENQTMRLLDTVKTVYGFNLMPNSTRTTKNCLFPVEKIPENKIGNMLRGLRNALLSRNISYHEFFSKIDSNKDGQINYDEFMKGIKDVINWSDQVISGVFAFFDRQKIGMVDFKTFLTVIRKTLFENIEDATPDTFNWENNVLKKIRTWFKTQDMKSEDAFRIIDIDYNQIIDKQNLHRFLKEILKIPKEELTATHIDRLYSLMDLYRTGKVKYSDFKRVLAEDESEPCDIHIVTGGKPTDKSAFDWKLKARQQIGQWMSKKNESMKEIFNEIAKQTQYVRYEHFKNYMETNQVLKGFSQTDKLMQQLFSDLDPHKKGHLTENDWEQAFGGYSADLLNLTELRDFISQNFQTPSDAWDYYINFGSSAQTVLFFESFAKASKEMLSNRQNMNDLKRIWESINQGEERPMSKQKFTNLFLQNEFTGSLKQSPGLTNTNFRTRILPKTVSDFRRSTKNKSKLAQVEPNLADIHSKLKTYLRTSSKTLVQVFGKYDPDNTGCISNLEFKEAVRTLNIGFTSREIDVLIKYIEPTRDNRINYYDFAHKFKDTHGDRQVLDRTRLRIHRLKDLIYQFLLSPKDAFHKYNDDRSGKMIFAQFQNMINTLSQYSSEQFSDFLVMKDLFDFIDTKRDGYIDIHEWMETFKRIEIPAKSLHLQKVTLSEIGKEQSTFEHSQLFDRIVKCISRNRKFLQAQFSELNGRGKISYDHTRMIIQSLVNSCGIRLDDKYWPLLINFAEKDGHVDYRYLLDKYKERTSVVDLHPNVSTVQLAL